MTAQILGLGGGICWLIVVLTHLAERLQLMSGMGWGLPNSPGHYLDLISAVVGTLLVLAAFALFLFSHPNSHLSRARRLHRCL